MNRIGLVRHGSTPWNVERRAQGNIDIPLNEEGISSAHKLAERLREEEWHSVFSSHLMRAKQTADIIAGTIGKQVFPDERLREVGGGLIEGTTVEERILQWGENWRELDLGIESNERVIERGLSFFDELTNKHTNQNILIVSHGSFIKQILKVLMPNFQFEESLLNTSLTILTKNGPEWQCELYNCVKHLDKSST